MTIKGMMRRLLANHLASVSKKITIYNSLNIRVDPGTLFR
jgi:hypothetical protein